MKKTLFISFLLLILVIAGCGSKQSNNQQPSGNIINNNQEGNVQQTNGNLIEMTSAGFSPKELRINAGDTVTFVNKDATEHWPASALHPTHTVYPETGGCIGSKFDACKGLKQGESWSFVFTQKGSWNYHDHLDPTLFGKIIVQ